MNATRPEQPVKGSSEDPKVSVFDTRTFDDYADLYEFFATVPYRKELETPTIRYYLGDLSGKRVMDFGCGPGFFSRWLKNQGADDVVGYDLSKGMIAHAQRQEAANPQGIRYLFELDDRLKHTFDIVLAIYIIPYISQRDELSSLLHSFSSLLKPGGKLITLPLNPDFNPDPQYYRPYKIALTEMEPRADGAKVNLHLYHHPPPYDVDLQTYYWSKQTLEAALSEAGFSDIFWRSLLTPPQTVDSETITFLSPYQRQPHTSIIDCTKL
ncbi:class I SAM-dependent methyltransferase [Martelella alba]|uniref:Class I SAM-dependent methyltransferase n=1 Tax=Martelella alba TaxID=2590451 RepID=A0ABY2SEW4_9HYPH|nr:class I SAM-dependent methyltransferase [Martelella alba]TKI03384.1 class I SAM-dependent methyltransferase [Martelella alba]